MSATAIDTLKMLVRYKAWANALTFDCVAALPAGEACGSGRPVLAIWCIP